MTETQKRFDPGEYVLTVDLYPRPVVALDGTHKDHILFRKGDVLSIADPAEAQALGMAGAIQPLGSIEAKRAQLAAQGNPPDQVALLEAERLEAQAREIRERYGGGSGEG